jgi:asparagine synthase (glutamine-hydrolysing)
MANFTGAAEFGNFSYRTLETLMSAIGGILRFDHQPVERRVLERVANALRMYGPDRVGVFAKGCVGLVHTLMRMTPEDTFEHQPWQGRGGATITADLRLDNRDELANRLRISIADIADWSDSRLLLASWEKFGDAIWPVLRGPFAAAIWQPQTRTLTLARDPIGVNVVMTYKSDRFLAFATMPKGLFALPDVPRELNEEKLADFLVLNHEEHTTTVYRDVFRVPPAHLAIVTASGSMSLRRYWSPADIRPVRLKSDDDYAEGLRATLDQAVRRQLRSAQPVGCYLTGGLDSSSVTALAARALAEKGERLSTYTQVPRPGFAGGVPPGCYADETPFVSAIAQMIKTLDVNYIFNDMQDDFELLERVFLAFECPVRNPTNLGWMMAIPRVARTQNRRVLLGGQLGNYTISWNGWSQVFDHARRGRLMTAYRQWKHFYEASSMSRWTSVRALFLEPMISADSAFRSHRRRKEAPPWARHAAIRADFATESRLESRARAVGHDFVYLNRAGERAGGLVPCDYLGDWNAALKGASGVEIRDPTADLDVIGYTFGVPSEQYLAEGVDRSLVRRAMSGLLPSTVLNNRLKGLQAADWYEKFEKHLSHHASGLTDIATSSSLVRKLVDVERLQRALATWPIDGWHRTSINNEYHFALSRGISMSRFIYWFEGANANSQMS